MNKLLNKINTSVRSFAKDEEGAQVIEYALIIAVVSVFLVIALQGLDGNFATFIARVAACLNGTAVGACV